MPNNKFFFGVTVDDVALQGWYSESNFRKLLQFFGDEGVKATFFVVPVDEETDKPFNEVFPELPAIIKEAHQNGHAFGQHGIRHNRFELGIPPTMVLDLPHETENKRYAETHKAELAAEHTKENCLKRLKYGREILEKGLGFAVKGFRAPAAQSSDGMFAALHEAYDFDSSAFFQETGWDYLLDKLDVPPRELDRERWEKITSVVPGKEFPGGCDYTWFLPNERYDITMKLAKHDLDACMALDVPFITVSHVDPVFNGEGIRFLKELFQYAKEKAKAEGKELVFANLETIAAQYNVR